ncbi:hypothetical protein U2F10_06165 [Leptothoe sp. EHU-05/26/07-4]
MSQVSDKKLKEKFCQQLLLTAQELIPNTAVNNTTVQPLATLTKLVVRHRETIRALKVTYPSLVIILSGSKIFYINEQPLTFEAGDLFVIPPHIATVDFNIVLWPSLADALIHIEKAIMDVCGSTGYPNVATLETSVSD